VGFSATLLFTTNNTTVMIMLFTALGMVLTIRSKTTEFPKAAQYGLIVGACVLALTSATVGTLYIWSDAVLIKAETSSSNKSALAERAARIAPWYGEAQYRAAMARGNEALSALDGGLPGAEQDARLADARFEQLVRSNPAEYQYRTAQAFFLTNAGRTLGPDMLNRAVAAGQAALDISPLSSQAAYLKGFAQYDLGDYSAAVETLKPLWEIDPKYMDPGVIYFRALVSTGDKVEAAKVLAKLEQRFPGNAELAPLPALLR
jgi:tetratricopeptide (TPR) repeat protein